MNKIRMWHAHDAERPIKAAQTVLAGDGFITASHGQIVIVAVVDRWSDAAKVLEALDPKLVSTEP